MQVTKDVQKVRDFEAALLRGYQAYLKALLQAAKSGGATGGSSGLNHASIAMRCMCELLSSKPHFNYTSDLLQAIVPRMVHGEQEMRHQCCAAITELLQQDVGGTVALEAVQLVADLIKKRKCVCPPDIVEVLLVMRFTEVKRPDPSQKEKQKSERSGMLVVPWLQSLSKR